MESEDVRISEMAGDKGVGRLEIVVWRDRSWRCDRGLSGCGEMRRPARRQRRARTYFSITSIRTGSWERSDGQRRRRTQQR